MCALRVAWHAASRSAPHDAIRRPCAKPDRLKSPRSADRLKSPRCANRLKSPRCAVAQHATGWPCVQARLIHRVPLEYPTVPHGLRLEYAGVPLARRCSPGTCRSTRRTRAPAARTRRCTRRRSPAAQPRPPALSAWLRRKWYSRALHSVQYATRSRAACDRCRQRVTLSGRPVDTLLTFAGVVTTVPSNLRNQPSKKPARTQTHAHTQTNFSERALHFRQRPVTHRSDGRSASGL
jgi:hypothetical protein